MYLQQPNAYRMTVDLTGDFEYTVTSLVIEQLRAEHPPVAYRLMAGLDDGSEYLVDIWLDDAFILVNELARSFQAIDGLIPEAMSDSWNAYLSGGNAHPIAEILSKFEEQQEWHVSMLNRPTDELDLREATKDYTNAAARARRRIPITKFPGPAEFAMTIAREQDWLCFYGRRPLDRSHFKVVAKDLVVANSIERLMNWIAVCPKHEDLKIAKSDHEYRDWLNENNAWKCAGNEWRSTRSSLPF